MSSATSVLDAIQELPPLPQNSVQILRLVNSPEFDREELVQLVSMDPALTARIIGLCNSSLFGLRQEVSTVSQAVGYLGSANLARLVVASCMAGYYKEVDDGYSAEPGEIWRHSVATAIAAQIIARQAGAESPGLSFTAGIIHNIGKICVSQCLKARGPDAAPDQAAGDSDFLSTERRLMGIDHCEAGARVAQNWSLPDALVEVCAHHHDAAKVLELGGPLAHVHIADILALQAGIGLGIDGLAYTLSGEVLDRVGLKIRDLDAITLQMVDELAKSQDLVKLEQDVCR